MLKGSCMTKESIEKIKLAMTGRRRGSHLTKDTIEKISLAMTGRRFVNSEQARKHKQEVNNREDVKEKIRVANIGKTHSETTKERLREFHNRPEIKQKDRERSLGQLHTEESIKKIRVARIKSIEQNHGICWPNYNKTACEYFKKFDEEHNTQGRYAVYGNGEYQIEQLGYFTDYINFDLKLIMEYDESFHYENDKLREKDKIRQEEIQKAFPDFKFERIKEA